jgi:hypothetical protein
MIKKSFPHIPAAALPHSVILKNVSADGIFREFDNSLISVSRVRVERRPRSSGDKSSGFSSLSRGAVMYYDTVNSCPKGLSFEIGQIICYAGQDYTVSAVTAVMDCSSVHHYKIELI